MTIYYNNDEEYDLVDSTDNSELLAELPFDLIKESIFDQITNPMNTTINFIDTITEKCTIYKQTYSDNSELIAEIDELLRSFFIDIIAKIDDEYSLGLDLNEVASYSDVVEVGQALYRYFILRYMKNITKFITNYIFQHKTEFCEYYSDKSKKDVSTLAFKKQIKNPEDLCIITNLPSIIKYILNLDIDSIEFVTLSAGEFNYDASVVKELIDNNRLIGDFYADYISSCVDNHDYVIDELQTEIRIKIINKMNK